MDDKLKIFLWAKISKLNLTAQDLPDLFNLGTRKFTVSPADIWREMADCFYEQGKHHNCLVTLNLYAHELGADSEAVRAIILARYSKQIEEHRKNYEHNRTLLNEYCWCCNKNLPSFEDLPQTLLFDDQQIAIYLDKQSGAIELVEKDQMVVEDGENIHLLYGINSVDNLCTLEEASRKEHWLAQLGAKFPLYLYYENAMEWALVIMQKKIDALLNDQRVVIFLSWQELEEFFQDDYAHPLDKFWVGRNKLASGDQVCCNLKTFFNKKEIQTEQMKTANHDYYAKHSEEVLQNIRSGKPRILFATSRFTTVLQYHIRDCMDACQRLGCETVLLIEPSDIHDLFMGSFVKAVHDFKPDLYFQINHFADRKHAPKQILGVTWIQDSMPHLLSPKTPLSLSSKDFILSYYPPKEELINIGYKEQQIMEALIPANHLLYKNYPLATTEREKYAADIILVANRNDWAKEKRELVTMLLQVDGLADSEKELMNILGDYYRLIYEEKINLNTPELAEQFWREQIAMHCGKVFVGKFPEAIVKEFFDFTRAIIFRNVLAEWLIDGGYTNLKLYGNDWANNPKFAPYAMGVAPNGETLAKIYQSAKILLGTNIGVSSTARVFECFLSGGFYIGNYIEPAKDFADIRKQYLENEEIPFFYTRKDLYAKLDYYLANPAERTKISENTRKKVLENSTYEALMKKILSWLAEKV